MIIQKNNNLISFSTILFVLACFPYVTLINTNFDTQPWALGFSVFFFFLLLAAKKDQINMPVPLMLLLFVLLYAGCIYFIRSDLSTGVRSMAGYFSLFFITLASYKTAGKVNANHFKAVVWIWFFVGIFQFTVDKTFGHFILPRMSTSTFRGVTSLAVEPSYLAIVALFFIIINDFLYAKRKITKKSYVILLILLLIQVFISYSGMGAVFVLIYFGSRAFSQLVARGLFKSLPALIVLISIPLLMLILFTTIEDLKYSRAGMLITAFKQDPIQLLYSDASVADRSSHMVYSFYGGLIHSRGIGNGLGMWNENADEMKSTIWDWAAELAKVRFSKSDRIMSGWGSAVFELGVIGLLVMFVFIKTCQVGIKRNKSLRSVYRSSGITIFFIMLMAVPLAFPLFSYTLGMMMYYAYKEPNEAAQ